MPVEEAGSTGPFRCLVCGVHCEAIHLGIGCRACSVFFKRGRQRTKPFMCKSGKRDCRVDRDHSADSSCKRCRFDKCALLYKDNGSTTDDDGRRASTSLASFPTTSASTTPRPVMERLKRGYEMILAAQRAGELKYRNRRHNYKPFKEITVKGETFAKGDLHCFAESQVVFIAALHDFARYIFPEFSDFEVNEQRLIIEKSRDMCNLIDSTFRTIKYFKPNPKIYIRGLTFYYHLDFLDDFFDGFDGDVKSALELLKETFSDIAAKIRHCMEEADLDETEVVASLALELWTTKDSLPDHINDLSDTHRKKLLQELHIYYKEVKQVVDYAHRIGKLFQVLMTVRSFLTRMDELDERYALLDIYQADDVVQLLERAHIKGEESSAGPPPTKAARPPMDPNARR